MSAGGGQDDASIGRKMWVEQVEKKRMTDVVDCERGFDSIGCLAESSGELKACIQKQDGDRGIGFGSPVLTKCTDVGKAREIKGEVGDVLLTEKGVDFSRGCVFVGSRGEDYLVLRVFAGNIESCMVSKTARASGYEYSARIRHLKNWEKEQKLKMVVLRGRSRLIRTHPGNA